MLQGIDGSARLSVSRRGHSAEILRAGRYAESDLEHLLEELSDMSRSERHEPQSRLMQRVVWVLTTAVTLNACDVCMTTQCRGRPFLPSQEVISGGHPGIQIPQIPRAVY